MPKRKCRFKSKVWNTVGRVRKSRCNRVFCLHISVILLYLPSITECNVKCLCPYLVSTLIFQNRSICLWLNSTLFLISHSACVPSPMDAVALSTGDFATTLTQIWLVLWFQLWLFKGSAMNTSEISSIVGVLWAMFLSVGFILRYAVSHPLLLG